MAKVLIIDDDKNICELLRLYLEAEGLSLSFAHDGSSGLDLYRCEQPDLILLDLMLPVINGEQVCQLIRRDSNIPIIMLTAKDTTDDKVEGLNLGADDYVVKPFDPKEIVARVKAQLRRVSFAQIKANENDSLKIGNLQVDLKQYQVWHRGQHIELKPKEIQLLHFLMENKNRVFSREQLIEYVWGYDYLGDTRTVDVHIKCLRQKLEHHENVWKICTVWGVGYKFEVKEC